MINKKIYLREGCEDAYLETFVSVNPNIPKRDAILVIPGGAYYHVCADREGEAVALAFLARGINAFVLKYRTGEGIIYPSHVTEAVLAMAHIRENADEYHIDPNRVFSVGFSAGGHLCGTLATKYDLIEKELSLPEGIGRPSGSIYSYAVVGAGRYPTNVPTYTNLTGKPFEQITKEEMDFFSYDLHINENTPPAFIWHTATDTAVPPYGSLSLAAAYVKAGVTVEMHLYPYGPHGIALATEHTSNCNEEYIQPKADGWVDEAVKWIKTIPTLDKN